MGCATLLGIRSARDTEVGDGEAGTGTRGCTTHPEGSVSPTQPTLLTGIRRPRSASPRQSRHEGTFGLPRPGPDCVAGQYARVDSHLLNWNGLVQPEGLFIASAKPFVILSTPSSEPSEVYNTFCALSPASPYATADNLEHVPFQQTTALATGSYVRLGTMKMETPSWG